MHHSHINRGVVAGLAITLCSTVQADDSASVAEPSKVISSIVEAKSFADPIAADASGPTKNPDQELSVLVGEPVVDEQQDAQPSGQEVVKDKEEVWSEISQAISGLNDMVGDEMFRDLRRTDDNRMEVRVDVDYWQRVRYQTRVDLKSDISNIWHLYVLQYSGGDNSSVYFIDDQTNQTIDIFSQAQ